jgi:hypothetical protein
MFINRNEFIYYIFLPQLFMDLLILSDIDRYAGAFSLISPIRRIRQLKMVPYLIGLTIIVSDLVSLHSFFLYDLKQEKI